MHIRSSDKTAYVENKINEKKFRKAFFLSKCSKPKITQEGIIKSKVFHSKSSTFSIVMGSPDGQGIQLAQ